MDELQNFSNDNKGKHKARNTSLFLFEAIACCLIVFMHCEFPGNFGFFMNSLAKFGVPLFFAVSGYFLYKEDASLSKIRDKLLKRSYRIFLLLILSFTIYFFIGLFISCFGKNAIGFSNYLKDTINLRKIILLFTCNDPLTNGINWFMIALLFSYLVIYLFPKQFMNNDIVLYIVSGLTIFWIIFRIIAIKTNLQISGFSFSSGHFYQAWYTCGLPFISLGILLRKKIKLVCKIPTYLILILLFSSLTLIVIEQFLLRHFIGTGLTYNIGCILSVFSIIVFSSKKPDLFSNSKILNAKGNWTTYVYIFHQAVIISLSFILSTIGIDGTIISWTKPILVLALSVAIAILFNYCLEQIKGSRKRNLCND